ncbi:MAG: hypothetical protein A2Z15_03420 [Chloroflexi bacterium RBG_16_50_11]|nr:MAG: hypothetical protein A2Z15_03420 [Chloroflexi bacterium RBG_16_50_11]
MRERGAKIFPPFFIVNIIITSINIPRQFMRFDFIFYAILPGVMLSQRIISINYSIYYLTIYDIIKSLRK